MKSICEMLGDTILEAVNAKRCDPIVNLEKLTVRMRQERRELQPAHTVPPEFIRNPLTEEGIRCITNNSSTCPINAAFLKALEDNNITPAMWNLMSLVPLQKHTQSHMR
jgi:hypothetical protein